MGWLAFALLAAVGYGVYNFFSRLSGEKVNPVLGVLLVYGVSLLVALVYLLVYKFTGGKLEVQKSGLIFPILAGLFTGVAEIAYLYMYNRGTPLNIGNPLVVGGTVVLATVLGTIILKEPLTLLKVIGILLTLSGLVILSR